MNQFKREQITIADVLQRILQGGYLEISVYDNKLALVDQKVLLGYKIIKGEWVVSTFENNELIEEKVITRDEVMEHICIYTAREQEAIDKYNKEVDWILEMVKTTMEVPQENESSNV